jgi:hypothetical protein
MVARIRKAELLAQADFVAAPARACQDQSFELPSSIYAATAALFLGFVGVLSFAFMSPIMAIVLGICVSFIAAFFAIPTIFVRTTPDAPPALTWTRFAEAGIDTATGRTSATEATILVLLLPFLILCWAIAIATIAALI